ncbi:MAG: hypothetical protein CBB87_03190 [Micavibrio sp. TMED27]|nr:succinate dehydrogenase assembly factor 2 [Micavibrio sp.]OUT91839.1 MAG: hypothetical protein CBB87_03190 [Micavibrio sp. TMED27]|tara:strand:- start:261 stop:527 length:267 start_codon:yes stop_codon:yes gene_type:complete
MSKNETIENKRKRLIFRSEHRGTKEMDIVMGSFARKNVPDFSEGELSLFDMILQENDPDLYNWLTRKEQVPSEKMNVVFEKLLDHKIA